jgi:hypothetical protein
MPKWEYCCITTASQLFTMTPGGVVERPEFKLSNFDDGARVISQLGLEGWEMVGMFRLFGHELWFKRPIAE